MVRTILNNPVTSQELLRREFIPAVPVSALLPTVSRIFRNAPGISPVPFSDGTILMSANIQDLLTTPSDALYTCLKWEEEKGRSGYICLHQVMLMAALQARMDGADGLSWRFAIPDEMAHEGRENLRMLFISLVDKVMQESGFPISESGLPVAFSAESAALGAYFRLCASEDTRGGFMVLDIGACTADISLFLRGREQAVRTCQIPLGIHYMLLPALLRDPLLLKREFGSVADETFQSDLNYLTKVLKDAGKDSVSLRKARLALDHFLSDYYPLLISLMNQYRTAGIPTRFGAVLLLHVSYLMMLSGLVLLQIAADPNRNDFLPEQMSLCLSGRGSLILEQMPDDIKAAVWHFLTMFHCPSCRIRIPSFPRHLPYRPPSQFVRKNSFLSFCFVLRVLSRCRLHPFSRTSSLQTLTIHFPILVNQRSAQRLTSPSLTVKRRARIIPLPHGSLICWRIFRIPIPDAGLNIIHETGDNEWKQSHHSIIRKSLSGVR